MGNSAIFDCRRCGCPTTLWGSVCTDCQAVLMSLGETDRWRSDYSRKERDAMTSRVRRIKTNVSGLPAEVRQPRRDQPQKYAPLDMGRWNVDPEPETEPWAVEARRRFAQMPQAPAVIEHATGLRGREVDPVCRQGHTKTPDRDGRLRCLYCEAERARQRRAADRQQEAS